MSSWLDILPSNERQKIREKYKMSAAAYEKLREKVKGPEELQEELNRNEIMAQLKFDLETQPEMKEALKKQLEQDLKEQGIEAMLKNPDISAELRQQLESGAFEVTVASPSEKEPDQLVVVPEGNISERAALSTSVQDSYLSQLQVDR